MRLGISNGNTYFLIRQKHEIERFQFQFLIPFHSMERGGWCKINLFAMSKSKFVVKPAFEVNKPGRRVVQSKISFPLLSMMFSMRQKINNIVVTSDKKFSSLFIKWLNNKTFNLIFTYFYIICWRIGAVFLCFVLMVSPN